MAITQAEDVWLEGAAPVQRLRSTSRIVALPDVVLAQIVQGKAAVMRINQTIKGELSWYSNARRDPVHAVVIGLVVALASTFLACTFGSPPPDPNTPTELLKMLKQAPIIPLSEGDRWTVYEDPGTIRVQHGYGCAKVGGTSKDSFIGFRIQDEEAAPNLDDRGAIFLNGWDMEYLNSDHHVLGLGSVIFNISRAKDTPGLNAAVGGRRGAE